MSFFLFGLFFGSGPCLASCGPVLISYIAGRNKNTVEALKTYFLFSLSRVSVYIILAILTFSLKRLVLENFIGAISRYTYLLGGSFIVLLGIFTIFAKLPSLKACRPLAGFMAGKENKNAAILGLIIGLLPCAPLAGILVSIGLTSKSWLQSLFYSASFGVGTLISPLIILAAFSGAISRLLTKTKPLYTRIFNSICGLIIIILGAQLIVKGFN